MAADETRIEDLVRQALDAQGLARMTSDPRKKAALQRATDELLQQAEQAAARQQGEKPVLGR
jgi:hypothetical protein